MTPAGLQGWTRRAPRRSSLNVTGGTSRNNNDKRLILIRRSPSRGMGIGKNRNASRPPYPNVPSRYSTAAESPSRTDREVAEGSSVLRQRSPRRETTTVSTMIIIETIIIASFAPQPPCLAPAPNTTPHALNESVARMIPRRSSNMAGQGVNISKNSRVMLTNKVTNRSSSSSSNKEWQ